MKHCKDGDYIVIKEWFIRKLCQSQTDIDVHGNTASKYKRQNVLNDMKEQKKSLSLVRDSLPSKIDLIPKNKTK